MIIQFYSKRQPGCSPKAPEGTELSSSTCFAFPTERYFSSVEGHGGLEWILRWQRLTKDNIWKSENNLLNCGILTHFLTNSRSWVLIKTSIHQGGKNWSYSWWFHQGIDSFVKKKNMKTIEEKSEALTPLYKDAVYFMCSSALCCLRKRLWA